MNQFLLEALNDLAARIHEYSKARGFYEPDKVRPFDGMIMNIVTEVAEAQEEWRRGREPNETHWSWQRIIGSGLAEAIVKVEDGKTWTRNYDYGLPGHDGPEWLELTPERLRRMPNMIEHMKPEGIPSEFADIIIRVLDICAYLEIDIANAVADKMAYNVTRPYRHGGKRS